MNSPKRYFIGIVGGGTKCKARLEDDQGNLLAESITGLANAACVLDGFECKHDQLITLESQKIVSITQGTSSQANVVLLIIQREN